MICSDCPNGKAAEGLCAHKLAIYIKHKTQASELQRLVKLFENRSRAQSRPVPSAGRSVEALSQTNSRRQVHGKKRAPEDAKESKKKKKQRREVEMEDLTDDDAVPEAGEDELEEQMIYEESVAAELKLSQSQDKKQSQMNQFIGSRY